MPSLAVPRVRASRRQRPQALRPRFRRHHQRTARPQVRWCAQIGGLKFPNDTLKAMGDFEMKNYGNRNWYLHFGLPNYNFMAARYRRA